MNRMAAMGRLQNDGLRPRGVASGRYCAMNYSAAAIRLLIEDVAKNFKNLGFAFTVGKNEDVELGNAIHRFP